MSIRKPFLTGLGLIAVAVGLFVASQNISLSMPKSLGYQSAIITGIEFEAGRFSANSYIAIEFQDKIQAKVPVDASFSAAKTGETVCIHSSTQWLSVNLTHRFAQSRKCAL